MLQCYEYRHTIEKHEYSDQMQIINVVSIDFVK